MSTETNGKRPRVVIVIVGTGTEVGKTWVATSLIRAWRASGLAVAARKPAQSFASPDGTGGTDDTAGTDAHLLGEASGELPTTVCPPNRWYGLPMAPPMAAEALGQADFTAADLEAELHWSAGTASGTSGFPVDVALVELAGGVCSPQAMDGDGIEMIRLIQPDAVLLVADAGLGTLNDVRLSVAALRTLPLIRQVDGPVVVLNRFDPDLDVHRRNLSWLSTKDGLQVIPAPDALPDLAAELVVLHSAS